MLVSNSSNVKICKTYCSSYTYHIFYSITPFWSKTLRHHPTSNKGHGWLCPLNEIGSIHIVSTSLVLSPTQEAVIICRFVINLKHCPDSYTVHAIYYLQPLLIYMSPWLAISIDQPVSNTKTVEHSSKNLC